MLILYSMLFDAYIELGYKDKALCTYQQMKQLWDESLSNIMVKRMRGGKLILKIFYPMLKVP